MKEIGVEKLITLIDIATGPTTHTSTMDTTGIEGIILATTLEVATGIDESPVTTTATIRHIITTPTVIHIMAMVQDSTFTYHLAFTSSTTDTHSTTITTGIRGEDISWKRAAEGCFFGFNERS